MPEVWAAWATRVALGVGARVGRWLLPLLVGGVVVLLAMPVLLLALLAAPSTQQGAAPGSCAVVADTIPVDTDGGGTKTTRDLGQGWQQNTVTILTVVAQRFPGPDQGQAKVVALATAMQESRLFNNPGGDRDSLGLFQQRPSQGWGTAAQIMDPAYATGRFLDALQAVPGWAQMPVTVAAQRVQRSGFPLAYAQWEPLARSLAGGVSAPCTPVVVGALLPGCTMSDLTGYGNGLLPLAALCAIPSAPGQMLRSDAAAAFAVLNEAYRAAFGVNITVTDSYRDLASQRDVYARKPGLAAKPGTSNHGLGVAVDLGGGIQSCGSTQYAWMRQNGPRFGWDNPPWARPGGSKTECWHWEYKPAPTPA